MMKIPKVPNFISYRDVLKKVRKPMPPPGKAMKDKSKYSRKKKHQGRDNNDPFGVSFLYNDFIAI